MRQTRAGSVAAGGVADHDLDALHRVYALHAEAAGVSADDVTMLPAALQTIVLAHRRMATHRPRGESVVGTSTPGSDGGTSFDVITDEMPFVVESLLAGFARTEARVRQVVHPVVAVRRDESGSSRRGARAGPGRGPARRPSCGSVSMSTRCRSTRRRRSWRSCASVLHDVRDVARRPGRHRRGGTGGGRRARRHASAEMDEARRAGRGTTDRVAGGRAFRPPRPSPLRPPRRAIRAGSGLGVLRREEVARRVFDGIAPDPSEDGDILVLTRASTPSRVFRPVHPSVLAVRIIDRTGRAVREHRFLGALTRPRCTRTCWRSRGSGGGSGRRCIVRVRPWSRTRGSGCSR